MIRLFLFAVLACAAYGAAITNGAKEFNAKVKEAHVVLFHHGTGDGKGIWPTGPGNPLLEGFRDGNSAIKTKLASVDLSNPKNMKITSDIFGNGGRVTIDGLPTIIYVHKSGAKIDYFHRTYKGDSTANPSFAEIAGWIKERDASNYYDDGTQVTVRNVDKKHADNNEVKKGMQGIVLGNKGEYYEVAFQETSKTHWFPASSLAAAGEAGSGPASGGRPASNAARRGGRKPKTISMAELMRNGSQKDIQIANRRRFKTFFSGGGGGGNGITMAIVGALVGVVSGWFIGQKINSPKGKWVPAKKGVKPRTKKPRKPPTNQTKAQPSKDRQWKWVPGKTGTTATLGGSTRGKWVPAKKGVKPTSRKPQPPANKAKAQPSKDKKWKWVPGTKGRKASAGGARPGRKGSKGKRKGSKGKRKGSKGKRR